MLTVFVPTRIDGRWSAFVACLSFVGYFMYRLMLLGRAAPVVNARLPLTEANVVSEDCGRGREPS